MPLSTVRPQPMDLAPALPPSQETVPDETPLQVAFLPEPSAQYVASHDASQQSSLWHQPSAVSTGFLSVSGLGRSFNFVGRAWRTAQIGNIVGRTLFSTTVPVQQVIRQDWDGSAIAADIQVQRVTVTPQIAQMENNVWAAAYVKQCTPGAQRQLQPGTRYKISIGDRTLGYVPDEKQAYLLAQQLKRLIRQASFDPSAIAAYPIQEGNDPSGASVYVGTPTQPFFAINATLSDAVGYSANWAAVAWANNLRLALDVAALTPGEAAKGRAQLQDSNIKMSGDASWYGPYFHGRVTANGEIYDQNELTVAHKSLPFGTQLQVRNLVNGRTVVVRVNDRGPYVGDRILDLSKAAADCIGSGEAGVVPVEATILKPAN